MLFLCISASPSRVSIVRVHSVLLGDVIVMEWARGGSAVQQLENDTTGEAVGRIA